MYTIGVLGLQGAVQEHIKQIEATGLQGKIIKEANQLNEIDGLIIPGGESTTMRRFIDQYNFLQPIKQFAQQKPVFGTCAGMVLLADKLVDTTQAHLQLIDITVKRNAFGRQRDSFEADIQVKGMTESFPAVFIRAPYVEDCGPEVEVLATYEGKIVAAKQENILVTAFHPELTVDRRFMDLFVDMVTSVQVSV